MARSVQRSLCCEPEDRPETTTGFAEGGGAATFSTRQPPEPSILKDFV